MSLNQQEKDKLRQDWYRLIPKPLPNAEIEKFAETVCDYWLKVIEERENVLLELLKRTGDGQESFIEEWRKSGNKSKFENSQL